jgi:hypothetical protein
MKELDSKDRGFYWTSQAYYARDHAPQAMFGFYDDDGCTTGEMAMRWHKLGDRLVPRLEVYGDAWAALATFGDVLAELALVDGEDITEGEFVALLKRCGFKDRTEYERPGQVAKLERRIGELEAQLEEARARRAELRS